ncbi:Uncharacterized protein PECH_006852 [Penicillium ucsense]|uniref:Uncharacterized protein n=1 Tax=Penicillium ucsense TaxID=2839758 RepID=A0A8J8WBK5_9EURO|nr:Uncharacterized protein PECM_006281 [Penicillium ucsense]KAF7735262.1 Uncharacterized protein PECH_006852 [Penicillium ucsense]
MSGLRTYRNYSLKDTPSLEGQIALVTGGQVGIGKEITAQLLLHGIEQVIVVARSEDSFKSAYDEWRVRKGIGLTEGDNRVIFVQCDLGDMQDTAAAAKRIKQRVDKIHIMICNAGLGVQPIQQLNNDGIDPIFAVNCIGHQILTTLLLPYIKKAAPTAPHGARIIYTSSSMHQFCRTLNLADLTRPTGIWPSLPDCVWRYGRSKVGNTLFAKELNRRLLFEAEEKGDEAARKIYVNSYFPGIVITRQWQGWSEHMGDLVGKVMRLLGWILGQSDQDAAASAMYLAASPKVKERDERGLYFIPIATVDQPTALAQDEVLARKLWDWVDDRITQKLGPGWKEE